MFELEGNKYYSFQMNDIFGMCEKYPQIVDLEEHIQTFDDTASLLKNLDVLITVDTALAHLAGAMGVKTYLLLCKAPDWRWFDNDKKTEWYPSVTIIKQHDRRTWEDVAEELFNEIAGKGAEARAKREWNVRQAKSHFCLQTWTLPFNATAECNDRRILPKHFLLGWKPQPTIY